MSDSMEKTLAEIQVKIQNLKSDAGHSGILQQLVNEAGQIIKLSDEDSGARILEHRDQLNFYADGSNDNLEKFYKCKAETLTIIAKRISL